MVEKKYNEMHNFFDNSQNAFGFEFQDDLDMHYLKCLNNLTYKIYKNKKESYEPFLKILMDLNKSYFNAKAIRTDDKTIKQIARVHDCYLEAFLYSEMDKKSELHFLQMSLGSLTQALVYFGMKKTHARLTISEWIELPQKTTGQPRKYKVREIEKFHQKFLSIHNPKCWFTHFRYSNPYKGNIINLLKDNPNFPTIKYPEANEAYKKILEGLDYDYKEMIRKK